MFWYFVVMIVYFVLSCLVMFGYVLSCLVILVICLSCLVICCYCLVIVGHFWILFGNCLSFLLLLFGHV